MKGIQHQIFKLSLLCAIVFAPIAIHAQSKSAEKANELFKYNQFAEAATLYEEAIAELEAKNRPSRSSLSLKTKLAYCYRMNNKMEKAEALYAEVVQEEKAKSDTYFFYAEALMSNGKYEEAKKWFTDYLTLEPEDEKAKLMIVACEKVPLIGSYFPYLDTREFSHNSPADDNAPLAWQGGILFSSDREKGLKLLKEKSGWTGRDYLDLYFSEKQTDGTFGEPKQFSSKLSEVNKNTGNASITADGAEIYFTRNDNVLNKQDAYSLQLYQARSAGSDRWKSVEKLSFCSPNYNFMHPAVSPDGQMLFFATNKAGGEGGTDLWVALRNGEDWSKPENLGPAVNTPFNEGFPFVDAEGRLYFCSKGHPGFGGFDIFVTERDANGIWATPRNLGKPINSPLDDISIYIAPDRRSGMFTSSRSGGDDDIYLFSVLDEAPAETVQEIAISVKNEAALPEPPLQETRPEASDAIENSGTIILEPEIPAEEVAQEELSQVPEIQRVETQETAPEPTVLTEINPSSQTSGELPDTEKPEEITARPSEEETPVPEAPIVEIQPIAAQKIPETNAPAPQTLPASFEDFVKKLEVGQLVSGERFRLDNAIYDPNIWQLTPRISTMLDKLVYQMRHHPSLKIELSAHTEALGIDEDNLKLSENRVAIALEYLVKEGISNDRIRIKGCGETMLLNHCQNGVTCSMDNHLFNQRLEIKILEIEGNKW